MKTYKVHVFVNNQTTVTTIKAPDYFSAVRLANAMFPNAKHVRVEN